MNRPLDPEIEEEVDLRNLAWETLLSEEGLQSTEAPFRAELMEVIAQAAKEVKQRERMPKNFRKKIADFSQSHPIDTGIAPAGQATTEYKPNPQIEGAWGVYEENIFAMLDKNDLLRLDWETEQELQAYINAFRFYTFLQKGLNAFASNLGKTARQKKLIPAIRSVALRIVSERYSDQFSSLHNIWFQKIRAAAAKEKRRHFEEELPTVIIQTRSRARGVKPSEPAPTVRSIQDPLELEALNRKAIKAKVQVEEEAEKEDSSAQRIVRSLRRRFSRSSLN